MGKKIFLIRHGQTDFNLNGIVQGSGVDSSLNENGRRQARGFYEYYQREGFEKVFTSALVRTHQSVQGFLNDGLPWQVLEDLNEISWGKHEGRSITPEEDNYYHWLIGQWQAGQTHLSIDGGESPDQVAERLSRALEVIMRDSAEKVLVCMHGRAMRIMLCLMLRYPLKCMDLFEHRNLCLYELGYTGSMFRVNAHNSTLHLANLKTITV